MFFLLLFFSMTINAMEDTTLKDVVVSNSIDQERRAERIIEMYFSGNGDQLKPQIVPRLSEKLTLHQHENALARLSSALIVCPTKERSPSTEEVFTFAERMLAASLHEVIEEKSLELASSERKKKCVTVIAICEAVGIVAASLAAILVAVYH